MGFNNGSLSKVLSIVGAIVGSYCLGMSEAVFWDLAVVKPDWACYPLPFQLYQICGRSNAGDAAWLFNLVSIIVLLLSVVQLSKYQRRDPARP